MVCGAPDDQQFPSDAIKRVTNRLVTHLKQVGSTLLKLIMHDAEQHRIDEEVKRGDPSVFDAFYYPNKAECTQLGHSSQSMEDRVADDPLNMV